MPLPKDDEQKASTLAASRTLTVEWSQVQTQQLLKEAHRAYGTEVNDLLLAALAMAVQAWSGLERVAVLLEGHGRETIAADVDVSRTVGWFTSAYPVVLEIEPEMSLAQRIKRVKETLRAIPHKGIGYGLLRYMSEPNETEWACDPDITFNYLGQFRSGFGAQCAANLAAFYRRGDKRQKTACGGIRMQRHDRGWSTSPAHQLQRGAVPPSDDGALCARVADQLARAACPLCGAGEDGTDAKRCAAAWLYARRAGCAHAAQRSVR
ncbi:hypothetical protein AZ66_29120 [Paenibacillus sp. E194]|nr:hypothetical protein AZ66_29120 [Paenibacillus sp. E194]